MTDEEILRKIAKEHRSWAIRVHAEMLLRQLTKDESLREDAKTLIRIANPKTRTDDKDLL